MLHITIPAFEVFDEVEQEIITIKEWNLQLEHSLVSISKWEAKWNKAFLGRQEKTLEESLDYIRCMTISQNVDPRAYLGLTQENIEEINNYISEPMTSVHFNDGDSTPSREVITSEVIYYWMITLNIPFECQKWHLNRLLALIRVINLKNTPAKKRKMSNSEVMKRNAELNASRKKKLNTHG